MKKHFLLYGFTIMVVSLTIFDMFGSMRDYSEMENRKLSKRPSFTIKGYVDGSFAKDYEEYVNDQFVGRDAWIDLKSRSEYVLGKIENNGIIYGRDNYLFDKFSSIDENRINKNKEALYKFIENNSDRSKVMLVPSSYQVYSELMPYASPVINQEERIEGIYSGLNQDNYVSVLDVMKNYSDEYIYYKTDHHWTTYGAYLAYLSYMESIDTEALATYDEFMTVEDFLGTYYSKAKKFNAVPDFINVVKADGVTMQIESEVYDSLYNYSYFEKRDKYAAFLNGNNALTVIKNNELNNGKKLLVIKDSYGNSMVPFLTRDFEEIHVVDLRSFMKNINQYIEENNFDEILVLYSLVNFSQDTNIIKLKF